MIKPVQMMMKSKIGPIHKFGHYLAYIWQYRGIVKLSVAKDLKGRFNNTILGYFWHLLNPLSQIIIYYLIFTVIFGRAIPNYWVYVSTGMFAFTFFLTSTSGSSNAIIGNSRMVTKMSMAKETIVISKVLTNLILLSISYSLLIVLMFLFRVNVSLSIISMPVILIGLTAFNLGLGLLLSALTVYVRDVANAAAILFGCMMFAVPVFYLPETRSTPMMEIFWSINPLYYYIDAIHNAFYFGVFPSVFELLICVLSGIITLIVGLSVFKRLEGGFAERL